VVARIIAWRSMMVSAWWHQLAWHLSAMALKGGLADGGRRRGRAACRVCLSKNNKISALAAALESGGMGIYRETSPLRGQRLADWVCKRLTYSSHNGVGRGNDRQRRFY
jgi:hypothetical protein